MALHHANYIYIWLAQVMKKTVLFNATRNLSLTVPLRNLGTIAVGYPRLRYVRSSTIVPDCAEEDPSTMVPDFFEGMSTIVPTEML